MVQCCNQDSPGEYLQFCTWSLVSILAFFMTFTSHSPQKKIESFIIAVVFLVIAMEEIEWGQRFFHFHVAWVESRNMEHEFNFHNMMEISAWQYRAWTFLFWCVVPAFYMLIRKLEYLKMRKYKISKFMLINPAFIIINFCLFLIYAAIPLWKSAAFYEFSELNLGLSFVFLLASECSPGDACFKFK